MPPLTYSDGQACSIKGMIWDFFFSPQLYVPTYAKEFCIKQLQEGSLMGDTLTLPS